MAEWFRAFQRSRAQARSPTTESLKEADHRPSESRGRSIFKAASFVNFTSGKNARPKTPTNGTVSALDLASPRTLSPDTTPRPTRYRYRLPSSDIRQTWHCPSVEQMVDALYYIMMTKPCDAPVPIEYNAYIQRLLEDYSKLRKSVCSMEQTLAEERETKRRSMDEFTKMFRDWEKKEADYKAEIRRVELLLADAAPDGVGAVVLARSDSVVDRSLAESKRFKARVREVRRGAASSSGAKHNGGEDASSADCASTEPKSNALHKTILTMRPNWDESTEIELSRQFRMLECCEGQKRRTKRPTHAFRPQPGLQAGKTPDPSEALPYEPLRSPNALDAAQEVHSAPAASERRSPAVQAAAPLQAASFEPTMATGGTTTPAPRAHNRTFSFDPGDDQLSLPSLLDPALGGSVTRHSTNGVTPNAKANGRKRLDQTKLNNSNGAETPASHGGLQYSEQSTATSSMNSEGQTDRQTSPARSLTKSDSNRVSVGSEDDSSTSIVTVVRVASREEGQDRKAVDGLETNGSPSIMSSGPLKESSPPSMEGVAVAASTDRS